MRLRADRGDRHSQQPGVERLRLAAGLADAAARARSAGERRYTWSKAFGICCDTLSDNPPQVQALDFSLNEARLPQDRPHNFQASFVAELPFGRGKPFLNEGASREHCSAAGRSTGSQPLFRRAVHGHVVGNVAGPAGQHTVRRSGEGRGRDSRRHRANRGSTRRHFAPSPSGGSARPASTACADRVSPTST